MQTHYKARKEKLDPWNSFRRRSLRSRRCQSTWKTDGSFRPHLEGMILSWTAPKLGEHDAGLTLSGWSRIEPRAPAACMGGVLLFLCVVRCGRSAPAIFSRKRLALLLPPPAVLLEGMLNYLTRMRITGCESWSDRLTSLQPGNRWLSSEEGYDLRSNISSACPFG